MIREALPQDASAIETLYRILLPEHPGVNVSPRRIEQIGGNPDSFLYVYEDNGQVVGTVHLHFCMDALSGDLPFAVIERVIIAPQLRGKGYGAALMRFAEEAAAARGALKVMLSSNSSREAAHRFYEALGYDGSGSMLFKKYIGN
ncbi:GNAT family N-acetyltransferase [Paenibacillus sp. sgz500992]|uniref:GNAT family N-acetyltransferase n=1 Tax=Paenibacillus sp. sgz500992 TaxID=3242476 RepID=UPI0036D20DC9